MIGSSFFTQLWLFPIYFAAAAGAITVVGGVIRRRRPQYRPSSIGYGYPPGVSAEDVKDTWERRRIEMLH